jgi:CopG family transcriptional regulator, nickel-responsive regulator
MRLPCARAGALQEEDRGSGNKPGEDPRMPDSVARFTISVPPELLTLFDEVSAGKGYVSRSEAVRDALREYLVAHQWTAEGEVDSAGDVVGTITLLYDPESRRLADELLERQHREEARVVSSMHVHLDARHCLEVIVVRGGRSEIATLADALISLRGVKHGRLVCTSTGAGLP